MKRDVLLDAWRGVAVLLVIASHSNLDLPFGVVHYAGVLGVDLFFVISGYIITKLLMEERERDGAISLPAFYLRRACRILPPLLVLMLIGFLIGAPASAFVRPSLFLCNVPPSCSAPFGHLWSLAMEEQFYLLWPCLVVMLPRARLAALLVLVVFSVAAPLDLFHIGRNADAVAHLAAGAFYASSSALRDAISKLPRWAVWLAWILVLLWLWLPLSSLTQILVPLTTLAVVFTVPRVYAESLTIRALSAVGLTSYGLYLYHVALSGLLLFPVALLSYFLIERPVMRWGKSLSWPLTRPKELRINP